MPDRGVLDRIEGSARELYRKVLGVQPEETDPGVPGAFDGAGATTRVAERIGRVPAGGGREALATAVGLASAGERATAVLSGAELIRAEDLLAAAAGRRLPLVVHCSDRESGAPGDGHAALHAAARAGAAVLVAADVQEAADLAVAGRRLAEDALVPVVVGMDGPETARSVQDVRLPTGRLLRAYLGSASDLVHPVTRAQELLHGRHRRRLLRWHDPSRPMTTGSLHGPDSAPLAAAGRRAYLDAEVPDLLETALADLGRRNGRPIEPVTAHRLRGAELVLVALGAAIGTAEAAADALRGEGLKVGVIGLRALAPFPEARLAELFQGLRAGTPVAVLERTETPFDDGAPLATRLRALTASLDGAGRHRVLSALYGLGGAPLRAADLAELARRCRRDSRSEGGDLRSPLYLGVSFAADAAFPKREVLLDALSRSHPDAGRLGLRGSAGTLDLRPEGSTAVALHRVAGGGGEGLAADAARLLHAVSTSGGVSTRPGFTRERWASPVADRLQFGGKGTLDPGADAPVDLAVWCTPEAAPTAGLVENLVDGGTLLLPRPPQPGQDLTDWWTDLPAAVREAVEQRGAKLFVVEVDGDVRDADLVLGSLLGALRAEGRVDFKDRKLLDARRELLAGTESDDSRRESRVAHLQTGLDRVHRLTAGDLKIRRRPPEEPDPVPSAVRRLAGARGAASETVESLPRFWDQVGVLYRRGQEDRLTPDPYIASGAVPQLSGSLRRVERGRTVLPAFDPAACTGCGACWTACPDGALAPVVLGAAGLLDHAMGRARKAGKSVDALRMAASKIAAGVHRELAQRSEEESGGDAAELFAAAFDKIVGKMPEPRREPLREAFAAVRDELAGLPLARTEPFFDGPEAEEKGSGGLFFLAVDPDACKGCGLCIAECAPEALGAAADDPVRRREARGLWRMAQELPDPPTETVERARAHPEVGALAGAMLPKASRETVAAADGADAGSGSALALRQGLATAAFHLGPPRAESLAALDALREELAGEIHEGLARALPDRDLDALAQGLGALERPEADLAELTGRVERALEGERVDVARLRRLVDVARRLADLRVRVGGHGGDDGRPAPAPLGLVLTGRAAEWGGAFPYSPFAVPVTVDSTGDGAGVARGLLEGSLADALAVARAARRARIEMEATTPTEADRAAEQVRALEGLTWRDLDPAERALCPPVFLVASETELLGTDPGGVARLLADDLPVKVLLLSEGSRPDRSDPVLAWAGQSATLGALIAQTSVGAPDHLEGAVAAGLAFDGPALVRVHAPEPAIESATHGKEAFPADATLERARSATASRTWPLFVSRPAPDHRESEAGDEETSEDRGAGLPVVDLSGNPEPDAASPETDGDGPTPDPQALRVWRLLQRWASADEAFAAAAAATEQRERLERMEREHRQEVEALRADYEQRLADARATTQAEMARRVRQKLLALASRKAVDRSTAETSGNGEESNP